MKEILRRMRQSFFIIFSGSIVLTYIFRIIPEIVGVSFGVVRAGDITVMLLVTVITNAMHLLLYSKKELSRLQLLLRYILALLGILTTITITMIIMEWTYVFNLFIWVLLWASAALVFAAVILKDIYQGRKLADKIHEKLKERYQE